MTTKRHLRVLCGENLNCYGWYNEQTTRTHNSHPDMEKHSAHVHTVSGTRRESY